MDKKDKDSLKGRKGFIKEEDFDQPQIHLNHQTLVERLIEEAIAQGKFDNLANEGRPIKIEEENPYIEEDMRLAYGLLARNGYAPPWVDMEKDVLKELEAVQRDRNSHRRWLQVQLEGIKQGPLEYFMRDLRKLRQQHQRWLGLHAERLERLNDKIHSFNEICPVPNLLKIPVHVEKVMGEYDKSCPAIPEV